MVLQLNQLLINQSSIEYKSLKDCLRGHLVDVQSSLFMSKLSYPYSTDRLLVVFKIRLRDIGVGLRFDDLELPPLPPTICELVRAVTIIVTPVSLVLVLDLSLIDWSLAPEPQLTTVKLVTEYLSSRCPYNGNVFSLTSGSRNFFSICQGVVKPRITWASEVQFAADFRHFISRCCLLPSKS